MDQYTFTIRRSRSGLGLFTKNNINKGVFLMDYTGELLCSSEAEKRGGKYLFRINSNLVIDGKGKENLARYINHSCEPNCEVKIRQSRIQIFTLKNVAAGEELNYDYGEDYFEAFIKPIGCKCKKCLN